MHLRSPPRLLIFTHARHRPDRYGRSGRFETGAFERELACVREDDRAVAIEMLGEADPVAAGEQLVELALREANLSKLEDFCSDEKNFKLPVMQAIERLVLLHSDFDRLNLGSK
jgi:hypothetical protein